MRGTFYVWVTVPKGFTSTSLVIACALMFVGGSPGSTAGGIKQSGLSTDSSGRLYVVQWSPTSNIWVIDPDNVDTAAANDGATVIPLGGTTGGGLKVAFGPDGKGYIGTSTASGGQVEIIDPSSRTVEKTVAMPAAPSAAQAINAGTVFANGTVYQQQVLLLPTGVSSAPYSYQSRMVTFPVGDFDVTLD